MEIADRLKQLIDYYELSPSALADLLEVQRSSVSHLLSGRNKPSLDFVMKVLENFPEVDLYWFVNGEGKFPINEKTEKEKPYTLFSAIDESEAMLTKNTSKEDLIEELPLNVKKIERAKEVDQIVIFYSDKTFTNYTPND